MSETCGTSEAYRAPLAAQATPAKPVNPADDLDHLAGEYGVIRARRGRNLNRRRGPIYTDNTTDRDRNLALTVYGLACGLIGMLAGFFMGRM